MCANRSRLIPFESPTPRLAASTLRRWMASRTRPGLPSPGLAGRRPPRACKAGSRPLLRTETFHPLQKLPLARSARSVS
eukprot:scaffold175307_cov51-Prasinocladus_malaysianus.AAC.2